MFFPQCLLPGCRIPSELSPSEDMLSGASAGVRGARTFPDNPASVHCAPPAFLRAKKANCTVAGLKVAHQQVAGASGAVLTLLPCMQSSCPCHCWGHREVWHFCSSLKFRSPAVLQHSDIIVASILRIASSRNVGGSGFSSLLVLTLHLQTQFLSFCKVRLFSLLFFLHNHRKLPRGQCCLEVKADESPYFVNEDSIYSFRLLQMIFAHQCISSHAKRSRKCGTDRTEVLFIGVLFPRLSEWHRGQHNWVLLTFQQLIPVVQL